MSLNSYWGWSGFRAGSSMQAFVVFLLSFALSALAAGADLNITVVDPQGQGVPGLVVYAQGPSTKGKDQILNSPVEIMQKSKAFMPYVSVVQKGQPVRFSNTDDITHHVYSVSGPLRFSFKLARMSKKDDEYFDTTAIAAMGCNIHDWMSGYLLVVDTPYFSKTNDQGIATLTALSPELYEITVWHPQLSESITQSIPVKASNALTIQLRNPLAPIPEQNGIDDFDFLDGYE